jgi:hypothetical protein
MARLGDPPVEEGRLVGAVAVALGWSGARSRPG